MNEPGTAYTVRVEVEDPWGRRLACKKGISHKAASFILPKDVCDSTLIARLSDGVTKSQMRAVTAARRMLAEQIAKNITEEILQAFEKQDTSNGYPR